MQPAKDDQGVPDRAEDRLGGHRRTGHPLLQPHRRAHEIAHPGSLGRHEQLQVEGEAALTQPGQQQREHVAAQHLATGLGVPHAQHEQHRHQRRVEHRHELAERRRTADRGGVALVRVHARVPAGAGQPQVLHQVHRVDVAVGVDEADPLPARRRETQVQRRALALVARAEHDPHPGQPGEGVLRAVGRAVRDRDDLVRHPLGPQAPDQSLDGRPQRRTGVVERHHDGQLDRGVGRGPQPRGVEQVRRAGRGSGGQLLGGHAGEIGVLPQRNLRRSSSSRLGCRPVVRPSDMPEMRGTMEP
ncbi:hypothetical protein L083_0800 [Actinoplanes sp. N902-109]|nr:hypothetical protein L083_0800 [Actinoplanes sp. N902-109]